jgi:hypothetical protein
MAVADDGFVLVLVVVVDFLSAAIGTVCCRLRRRSAVSRGQDFALLSLLFFVIVIVIDRAVAAAPSTAPTPF